MIRLATKKNEKIYIFVQVIKIAATMQIVKFNGNLLKSKIESDIIVQNDICLMSKKNPSVIIDSNFILLYVQID